MPVKWRKVTMDDNEIINHEYNAFMLLQLRFSRYLTVLTGVSILSMEKFWNMYSWGYKKTKLGEANIIFNST